ncbi:heterokaryon incompatibility protein-domain-containing protein [Camillea tinctor]|nr:heterokaryon incompatibility protein-domain-containing protein [Camillea tinctor]
MVIASPHKSFFIGDESEPVTWSQLRNRSQTRSSTGHEDVAALAKWLLSQCIDSHKSCFKPISEGRGAWKPLRLLEVSHDQVRLVLTEKEDVTGPYATLSHCWGKKKFFVLTSENFAQFTAGLPIDRFPKTFQETMTTVRRLGIKYLWIDSYCIIQGDEGDWKHQAAQMHQVYTNSLINIGAANADGPTEGLFHERHGRNHPSASILWSPKQNMNPRTFRIYDATCCLNLSHLRDSFGHRLFNRGWVLQETMLTPRMLTFTPDQIFWQCSEAFTYESHIMYISPEEFTQDYIMHSSREEYISFTPFWALSKVGGLGSYKHRWLKTVNLYSRYELTYPDKDIFEAISGIGQHLASLTGDTFRYGILSSTLFDSLSWRPDAGRKRVFGDNSQSHVWRLPSWHWCSLTNEAVNFLWNLLPTHNWAKNRSLAFVFISDDCKPLSIFPMSKDLWPNLLCIGRTIGFKSMPDITIDLDDELNPLKAKDHASVSPKSEINWENIVCLPLVTYSTYKKMVHGLLLQEQDNGAYRRLGLFYSGVSKTMADVTRYKPRLIVLE